MLRWLENTIKQDLDEKIVLVSGPRQVGKTTIAKSLYKNYEYLNYDSAADRKILTQQEWQKDTDLVVFDELHKMKKWKSWVKGIYDTHKIPPRLLVTGSARLDNYRKGGDSLAGRHFTYRLNPFTVKELKNQINPTECLETLLRVGGFPQPFLKDSEVYAKRWRNNHLDVILREDLLDLEKVRQIKSIEILVGLLKDRVGSTVSYTSLANDLQVSVHTVKHWLQILENLFVIFAVHTYHRNITRSLLKDTKYYFYDTGAVDNDEGKRLENTVALALKSELNLLEDTQGVKTQLCFLRNKEKHEIDFLTETEQVPTSMIEVKLSDNEFSKSFFTFQKHFTKIKAYQVVKNLKRKRENQGVQLVSAVDFLKDLPIA